MVNFALVFVLAISLTLIKGKKNLLPFETSLAKNGKLLWGNKIVTGFSKCISSRKIMSGT